MTGVTGDDALALRAAGNATRRAAALAAISALGAGLIDLIEFARGGETGDEFDVRPFLTTETIEHLADALKLAIGANGGAWDEQENQLLGACEKFMEGWA